MRENIIENKSKYINKGKNVIDIEINALVELKKVIGDSFIDILRCVVECKGKVVLCGMGKSGHVAKKISATMASLGTPSFYLHPSEAQHGDMGMVEKNDIVILISNSGETEEILRLIQPLKVIGSKLIAITSGIMSSLAQECDYVQIMPVVQEACNLNLAPTSTTTNVMAYGDALAVAASEVYGFTKSDFGLFHPAGLLGKRLLIRVCDLMACGENVPIIHIGSSMSDAIVEMSKKTLGMLLVVDNSGKLKGLLTDGDLRRAIERKIDVYNCVVDDVMTLNPKTICENELAVKALNNLKEGHINNYPVIDKNGELVGAITWQMIVRAGIV